MLSLEAFKAIQPKLNELHKQPNTTVKVEENPRTGLLDTEYEVTITTGGVEFTLDGFAQLGDLQVYRKGEYVPGAETIPGMASSTARRCHRHDAHRTPWERQADVLIF